MDDLLLFCACLIRACEDKADWIICGIRKYFNLLKNGLYSFCDPYRRWYKTVMDKIKTSKGCKKSPKEIFYFMVILFLENLFEPHLLPNSYDQLLLCRIWQTIQCCIFIVGFQKLPGSYDQLLQLSAWPIDRVGAKWEFNTWFSSVQLLFSSDYTWPKAKELLWTEVLQTTTRWTYPT